ncbi:MAG: hypothetical protein ACK46G_02575 [Flavobacteriales bacterium]|jgi:hypothetical protein
MSEIVVNGRIKVKSFYLSFNKAYPYLHAGLRDKAGKGIDPDRTIANAREMEKYEGTTEAPLSVRGNLQAGTFEGRFKESFGITCQIHYRKGGKWAKLNAAQGKMTLNELNAALKVGGADVIDPKLLV